MPNPEKIWTVAERDALPEDGWRYEVIDGVLYMSPAPTWPHQRAVRELLVLLDAYVKANAVGALLAAPADVVFSPITGVQPDLFVTPLVDGREPNSFEEVRHLFLAIEVLSPSTARTDRKEKRVLYGKEGVEQYWVVDLERRVFERSMPNSNEVELLADRIEWQPTGATQPLVIDLETYFSRVLGG